MSNDDTTRRKRAEKSLLSEDWKWSDEDYEWAHRFSLNSCDRGFLHGYLAGAREEAAIKDAEIKDKVNEFIEAVSHHHLAEESLRAEIAKLQEAVRLVESSLMRDLMQSGESVTADLLAINWIERPEVQRAIGAGK